MTQREEFKELPCPNCLQRPGQIFIDYTHAEVLRLGKIYPNRGAKI